MKNRLLLLGVVFGAILFIDYSCVPADQEPVFTTAKIDYSDTTVLRILNFQDEQKLDSLLFFTHSENPAYRLASAQAFASFRDTGAIDQLVFLLNDEFGEVRSAAAYALGQIGNEKAEPALIKSFNQYDSTSIDLSSNSKILEAVGKIGGLASLNALSTVSTYRYSDSLLLEGQTRGIYRFGLRGIISPEGTDRMVKYVCDAQYPEKVREMAVNYLFRMKGIGLDTVVPKLVEILKNDPNPYIRMALATAIGKVNNSTAMNGLLSIISKEQDYRVLANAMRALKNYSYRNIRETMFSLVDLKNIHLAEIAASYLIDKSNQDDALRIRTLSQQNKPWAVKAKLYAASNKHLPSYYAITKSAIHNEIKDLVKKSKGPYEKAAYIRALGEDLQKYEDVKKLGFSDDHPAVRVSTIQVLGNIAAHPKFRSVFGGRRNGVSKNLTGYFIEAIKSKDPGMIAAASIFLRDENVQLSKVDESTIQEFKDVLSTLSLPKDIEPYNELLSTIGYFENNDQVVLEKLEFNHPISWSSITPLKDRIKAEIITERGMIEIELYPKHAPGSVANFTALAKKKFYHGLNFHRVVPNFVIQGGCPRGDGYGSLDYSIRSELGPKYYDEEGYIGMASAGNHTEGTQFFITHSPTPHLDGNYTIFGKVLKGMDIVHQIEVGDKMMEVNILE